MDGRENFFVKKSAEKNFFNLMMHAHTQKTEDLVLLLQP